MGNVRGEHHDRRDLRYERLGGGDGHLGSGLQEHRRMRLASDRRADGVRDRDHDRAAIPGQTSSGDRVGSFARLRNGNDKGAGVERRRAVAELRRYGGSGGNPKPILEERLTDQRCVIGGATSDHLDTIYAGQSIANRIQLLQIHRVAAKSARHGRRQRRGLLVNLLEHEMSVAALFGSLGGPGDYVDDTLHRHSEAVGDRDGTRSNVGHIAVGEEDDPLGVGDDRRHVRRHETFALAQAYDQRGVQSGANESLRFVAMHHDKGVSAFEAAEGGAYSVGQVAVVGVFHEMGHNLGVRLRLEDVALGD
jgi:hypothetical protein